MIAACRFASRYLLIGLLIWSFASDLHQANADDNHAPKPSAGPATTAPVQIEHVGEEWDAYGNFLTVVKVTNRTDRNISYAGYSPSSPAYFGQIRASDADEWRDLKSAWCGVGLGTQQLRAQQSSTFRVLPPEGAQSWRIGLRIESPQAHVIWTQPITANTQNVPEAPSAAELVLAVVAQNPERRFPHTFTLKNISDTPLFYGGFQELDVPPIYLVQTKRSEGWQDDGKADWSGSGFGFKQLPPGRSISFSVPAQSADSTWRIGVRLFRTARPVSRDDAFRPVWWSSLPPRNEP